MDTLYDEFEPQPDQYEITASEGSSINGFLLLPVAALLVSAVLVIVLGNLLPFPTIAPDTASAKSLPAAGSAASIAPLFSPEVQYWKDDIVSWSAKYKLDPNLVATVMQIESCGDPQAKSSAGASGLFQVMPFHFAAGEDPFDPQTNAKRGLGYLKSSLSKGGGDKRLALAGYNGGIGVIAMAEAMWAAETVRYAYWGSGIYADAAQGAAQSQRLQEWLSHGGASLCARAHKRLSLP